MTDSTAQLVDSFVSKLNASAVHFRTVDNGARLRDMQARTARRLPQSFEFLLERYSFPTFDAGGVSFFGWESGLGGLFDVPSTKDDPLTEMLFPSGYFQIGRPDTGSFDAICFDQNSGKQNREHPILQIDHEQILCNSRIRIVRELWPSFIKLMEHELSLT